MYRWYADNTEFRKTKKHHIPNIFLFGGILVDHQAEKKLAQIIEKSKSKYTHPDLPIKWNFKDVREIYERFDRIEEFEEMKHDSYQWRKDIFKAAQNIDYKIFIAAIENFQAKSTDLDEIKGNLIRYVFSNVLMRVALYTKQNNLENLQPILDWPESSNPKPFNREYYYAYNRGKNCDGQDYFSGPLKKLGCQDSILFTKMNHSVCLQFADLIIGAVREFLKSTLKGRKSTLGEDYTKIFVNKFYGYPNNIIGQGINISSNNAKFKSEISEIIASIK